MHLLSHRVVLQRRAVLVGVQELHHRSGMGVVDGDLGVELDGERLDDAGAKARLGIADIDRHADAVVGDAQDPA